MAAGGELVQHSTITVETAEGNREIQLLFGDITSLPIEDRVDVILVSAFQGDYAATPSSLIGALKWRLGLSVRDLARNKKEDLRRLFHCWQSHPLPTHLPYGQLVCFEVPFSHDFQHPAELVSDVFRALIPIFQNEERSVITPLLATGDQNYSQPVMLKAMLKAAISWVRAGLPMKCLKIVMYKRGPGQLSPDQQKLVDIFNKESEEIKREKKKMEQHMQSQMRFDVYLSYNEEDRSRVGEISKLMLKEDKKLRIFEVEQHLNKEEAFQEEILNTMKESCRVVTILSPAFLESSECMEKYNLALCVNRRVQKNILAPFYIETITCMPTYMTLVQYVDVRDRDGTNMRMLSGVHSFVMTLALAMQMNVPKPMSIKYDVFLSYSHKNSTQANQLLSLFQKKDPKLRIFFDRNELKTGFSWQQTLYHAVDNASVMVALFSPDYVSSTVCQEEYCIALCRHLSEEGPNKMELVPVLIEECEDLPHSMTEVPLLAGTSDFAKTAEEVARAVINFAANKEKDLNVFNPVQSQMDVKSVLAAYRKRLFDTQYEVQEGIVLHKGLNYHRLEEKADDYRRTVTCNDMADEMPVSMDHVHHITETSPPTFPRQQEIHDMDAAYDIAFVSADPIHGAFLDALFQQRAPYMNTNFRTKSEQAEIIALEKATICVIFLSSNLATVGKDVEEVDVALARQRRIGTSHRVVYPVAIGSLPRLPTYIQLMPCNVDVTDQLWTDVLDHTKLSGSKFFLKNIERAATYVQEFHRTTLSNSTMMALSAACDDILSILQNDRQTDDETKSMVISNVVSLSLADEKLSDDVAKPVDDLLKKWNRPAGQNMIVNRHHIKQNYPSVQKEDDPTPSTQTQLRKDDCSDINNSKRNSATTTTCHLF